VNASPEEVLSLMHGMLFITRYDPSRTAVHFDIHQSSNALNSSPEVHVIQCMAHQNVNSTPTKHKKDISGNALAFHSMHIYESISVQFVGHFI
jgi:hypothetical protein